MQVHRPQVCSATLLLPWPILPLQEATLLSLGSSPKTVVSAASQESGPEKIGRREGGAALGLSGAWGQDPLWTP